MTGSQAQKRTNANSAQYAGGTGLLREEYKQTEKRLPGLNPVSYGQQKCEPGFSVNVPRPYWVLHFVVAGKGRFFTGGASYDIKPAQIFVIHPHQTHEYRADDADPWHYMWVCFDSDIDLPQILSTDVITAPDCGRIFSEILEATHLEAGKEEYLSGKIWELMSALLRLEAGRQSRQNPYVVKAKRYIEQNYMTGIRVTDIARELNLDRSYFSTLFRKYTGVSPQQYLNDYRLERAAHRLALGEDSVAAAAYYTGYSDIVNFSRMFKKHFGVAPSKYREMIMTHAGLIP